MPSEHLRARPPPALRAGTPLPQGEKGQRALERAPVDDAMTTAAHQKISMRPFLPADVPMLAEIFRASVEELTAEDYSEAQREAWAAAFDDEEALGARLGSQLTLLGVIDGSPVGFASLKGADEIDMLYVHPAAAGKGIGTMLIDALEKLAVARGAKRLVAEVSDSAQDFFKQRGFVAQRRNTIELGNEWLANTTMEKKFATKEATQ
jgi:putative acetyltransferase